VGATWRKASLRALGTLVGGALGGLSVAATSVLCDGWPAGAPHKKVAAMCFIVASIGAAVQAARARNPTRDYAYSCCTMARARGSGAKRPTQLRATHSLTPHVCGLHPSAQTLALTALSDFQSPDADAVLAAVAWRLVTIIVGGLFALATALVIAPEYASAAAGRTLAGALRDAGALLRGVLAAHGVATAKPTAHPELHAAELKLARALDRYTALCGAGLEERALHVGAAQLDGERAAAAGAAARGLFTGAVALLHVLEAGPQCGAAAARVATHGAALGTASEALHAALDAAAALAAERTHANAGRAVAALRAADVAVDAFAAAVAEGASMFPTSASAGTLSDGDDAPACATPAAACSAVDEVAAQRCVSSLALSLADAARNVARVVANTLPDAEGLPQRWSAQSVLARGQASAVTLAREALDAVEAAAAAARGGYSACDV
jgi:hypothetical protein